MSQRWTSPRVPLSWIDVFGTQIAHRGQCEIPLWQETGTGRRPPYDPMGHTEERSHQPIREGTSPGW
ncbi:hypothetical protein U6R95_12235, partial [Cutibacterium acnes]